MKLEVGRIYVLVDSSHAFSLLDKENKPLLVKVLKSFDMSAIILGLDKDGYILSPQVVDDFQLKPASEKQRTIFNNKYRANLSENIKRAEIMDKAYESILFNLQNKWGSYK